MVACSFNSKKSHLLTVSEPKWKKSKDRTFTYVYGEFDIQNYDILGFGSRIVLNSNGETLESKCGLGSFEDEKTFIILEDIEVLMQNQQPVRELLPQELRDVIVAEDESREIGEFRVPSL